MNEQQEKKTQVITPKKKPFKLCFVSQNLLGKSNVQIGKPLKMPNIITPKFYTDDKTVYENSNLEKQMEYLLVKGPREIYPRPITENQRYGWYQVRFTDMDTSDRRLNYAKHTDPIVKEHLRSY